MLDDFKERVLKDFPNIATKKLFLAVSGGKDSMVLSHLLLNSNLKHTLLHCNFNLRGDESDEDQFFLENYARKNSLEIQVKSFNTIELAETQGKTIQEIARDLRYSWFRSLVDENSLILTAHHLDDSIETFFINLMRGTGYKGVSGIPKLNLPFYRPLLEFKVEEIYHYIDKNGIEYRKDSSNSETKYLRNKLRHNILSQILELEPNFKTKMAAFFSEMHELSNFIDSHVNKLKETLQEHQGDLCTFKLKKLQILDRFSLLLLLRDTGIMRSNLKQFEDFLSSPTGKIFETPTHQFLVNRDSVHIRMRELSTLHVNVIINSAPCLIKEKNLSISLKLVHVEELSHSNQPIQMALEKVQFPLHIRNWETGDKINPLGMQGSKLISDVLIDHKLSRFQKEKVLVVMDANRSIVAIADLMIAETVKCDDDTKELIEITPKWD